jgi:hypothetical protein
VPFGTRAYPESEERRGDAEPGEFAAPQPPRPDAFWGEDSAEIHAVMPGPDANEPRGRLAPLAARSRFAAFRAHSNDWLRSQTVGVGRRSHTVRVGLQSRLQSHPARVAAGVAVAVACAAVALARLGGSPAVDSNQPRATAGGGPAAGLIADGPASAAIGLALLRSNAQHRTASAMPARSGTSRHRPRRAERRSRTPKTAAHSAPAGGGATSVSNAPAATSEPVVSSAVSSVSSTDRGSSVASPQAAPTPTASSSHSNGSGTTSSTSGQTSSGSSARAASHRPSSATPTGAAGALGPIGSPNG